MIVLEGKGAGIWEDNRWGYLSLLEGKMPGTLDENDEENEFYLPWNLQLEKASDTFNEIDVEDETMYLDGWLDEDEYGIESDGIWEKFNMLYNAAEDAFMTDHYDGSLWLDAYSEFRNVCVQLKEEGKLPPTFEELYEEDDDFEGVSLIEDMIDDPDGVEPPALDGDDDWLEDFPF